jgi:hypothetical protein
VYVIHITFWWEVVAVRPKAFVLLLVALLVTVPLFGQKTVIPLVPLRIAQYYLTANLQDMAGSVVTEKGEGRAEFFGSIAFRVVPGAQRGAVSLYLSELNLVSKGVGTPRGDSGVLSLGVLNEEQQRVEYDSRTGRFSTAVPLKFHYELIDRMRGFRQAEGKGEADLFAPYTEVMFAEISGRFTEPLQAADDGKAIAEFEIMLKLASPVIGVIHEIRMVAKAVFQWWHLLKPAEFLRIQPVFIGYGPTDPNRTGSAFDELMKRCVELWNRCGSVRCIKFAVNTPIYINNPAYRVLDSSSEAASLRAEVSVADAVEVFVVDHMVTSVACSWGGGACWGSGTASAKVVSCDQQLSVPCPCPTACTGYCPCGACQCGPVNYYHLAHELGHALNLDHPGQPYGLAAVTYGSNMEPSGFCCDNPNVQSAKNCRNASSPLLYWGSSICSGTPDIND